MNEQEDAGAIFDAHVRAGRKVQLPHVVVMGIVNGKVAYEQIYWDQASLLVQVGVLDPAKLPVTGAEQAHKLMDPTLPSNDLIRRAERSRAGSHRP
jgi:carboxymethylenebutenolidase